MGKKLKMVIIKRHHERDDHEEQEHHKHTKGYKLPYENEASDLMSDDFEEYVQKHGYHFTDALAEHVSKKMENANGLEHTWSVSQVKKAMEGLGLVLPNNTKTKSTLGDITYQANMYYADLYPDPFKDEASCIKAAYKIATDPDGYDGMIFCRWTSDAIGTAYDINWKNFI